jgi:hypothetical protein
MRPDRPHHREIGKQIPQIRKQARRPEHAVRGLGHEAGGSDAVNDFQIEGVGVARRTRQQDVKSRFWRFNPPVADGTGDTFNPLITAVAQPTRLIGGFPATVLFSGLTLYPGLHQINVTMPPVPPGAISLPLAIITSNAYHNQVDMPVQP